MHCSQGGDDRTAADVSFGQPIRPAPSVACTGKTIGPSLYHLMEVLGKERVLHRLDRALEMSYG